MTEAQRVLFVGIGKMGLPMAGHLRAAGYRVVVADRDPARLQQARLHGCTVGSIEGDAAAVSLVVASLPDDAALESVADAVVRAGARAPFVDTSTVSPQSSARVAERCRAHGIEYLRCALSGNSAMAEAAQLTVLASGPRPLYERLAPLLRCFGPTTFYLGEAEQARQMKLVLNLMIVLTSGMLAEALALGRRGGLRWDTMWEVIAASALASPIVKAKSAPLKARDFTATFTVEQMLKDVSLIDAAARDAQVPIPLTAQMIQALRSACAQGDAQADYAAVIRVAERAAGIDPAQPG